MTHDFRFLLCRGCLGFVYKYFERCSLDYIKIKRHHATRKRALPGLDTVIQATRVIRDKENEPYITDSRLFKRINRRRR